MILLIEYWHNISALVRIKGHSGDANSGYFVRDAIHCVAATLCGRVWTIIVVHIGSIQRERVLMQPTTNSIDYYIYVLSRLPRAQLKLWRAGVIYRV